MKTPEARTFSLRCPISHRPSFRTGHPVFFRCPTCGAMSIVNHPVDHGGSEMTIECCGVELRALPVCDEGDLYDEHRLRYKVLGGLDHNALRLVIGGGLHPMDHHHSIEWVYLRTFQGGQLKYLTKGRRSIVQFAFADEDAYVYCDRQLCKMGNDLCQFQCKRGLTAYAYCSQHGLFSMTLTGSVVAR